jgi:hypothetical protein
MREERSVSQDVIGTGQQKEESKAKKYVRIAFGLIFMVLFAILIVAAAMNKFGS